MKASRILAGIIALAGASCFSRQAPSSDWPRPVPLKSLSQLGGIYRNEGQGGGGYDRSLHDLLKGRLGTSNAKGDRTELKPAPDGKTIVVLLRDQKGTILESTLLRENDDFLASRKGLSVKVPGSIGESGVTNLGIFAGSGSVMVMPAEDGSLLGRQSEHGAGFIGFMIPIAAGTEENYYWPAIPR